MSASVYDQSNRYLDIQTDLGTDLAILTELEGEDALSKPFLYRIRFATEEPPRNVKILLGRDVAIHFGISGSADEALERRPLHGAIRRLGRVGRVPLSGTAMVWEAEVVPRLWFLSLTSDFRVFQDMSIPRIISAVLDDNGLAGQYELRPSSMPAGHGTLEYCVQYNETALDFVSRLMEQAGLFYWHEHSDSGHKLIISEDNSYARVPSTSYGTLRINGAGWLTSFHEQYAFRTGKWTVRDYNLLDPETEIDRTAEWGDAGAAGGLAVAMQARERYGYPGLYMARVHASSVDFGGSQSLVGSTDATTMSNLLIEVEEANWQRWVADSQAVGLDPGTKVRIDTDLGTTNDETDFLVTSVRHKVTDYSHWTAEMWGAETPIPPACSTHFECAPFSIPFRPERATRKPAVQGPQTAIVLGPAGEEIHTDKYGRVKVQFPWRRPLPDADTATCWVRVSQGWAGNGWGQMHLPRVGDEVVVDFLDGDPDRPIVTGRVYHHTRMPPHELPKDKTKSGIKTRSSPGGTSDNYNELTFDDAIGSEQVLLHAERDYTVEVENNETRTIGIGSKTGNRDTTIKNNEKTSIGADKSTTVTGDFTETIGGNEKRTVTGSIDETVTGSITQTVAASVTETIGGTYTQTVASTVTVTAGGILTLTAPTISLNAPASWFTTGSMTGSAYGLTAYIAGAAFAVNGFSATATGVAMAATGVAMNATGMSMNATGLSMSVNGVNLGYNGVDMSDNGVEVTSVGAALKAGLHIHS